MSPLSSRVPSLAVSILFLLLLPFLPPLPHTRTHFFFLTYIFALVLSRLQTLKRVCHASNSRSPSLCFLNFSFFLFILLSLFLLLIFVSFVRVHSTILSVILVIAATAISPLEMFRTKMQAGTTKKYHGSPFRQGDILF